MDDDLDSIDAALQQHSRLSAFTEDELFDELKRRNDAVILLTHSDAGEADSRMHAKWEGGIWVCIGMAQQFAHDLLNREYGD
jgi:hypothetical protein